MTASLLQLQILTLCAFVACARFFIAAFHLDYAAAPVRFTVFCFSTVALFIAAVL